MSVLEIFGRICTTIWLILVAELASELKAFNLPLWGRLLIMEGMAASIIARIWMA